MSKSKLFSKQFTVNFTPLQWVLVNYYAWKYKKDKREIIRSIVTGYINADKRFDREEFLAYSKRDLKNDLGKEDAVDLLKEMKRQAKDYAATRKP